MKTIVSFLVALTLSLASVVALAQAKPATGSAEYQAGYEKGRPVGHILDLYIEKQAWDKIGISGFALMTKDWAEAYAGPTYSPAGWVSASMSFGGQQHEGKVTPRYATSLWMGGGERLPFQFLGFFEGDGSLAGAWYDAKALYSPLSWLSLGVHGRRFVGIGPRVEINAPIPGMPVTVWATWNPYDPESKNEHASKARGIIGVKASF